MSLMLLTINDKSICHLLSLFIHCNSLSLLKLIGIIHTGLIGNADALLTIVPATGANTPETIGKRVTLYIDNQVLIIAISGAEIHFRCHVEFR